MPARAAITGLYLALALERAGEVDEARATLTQALDRGGAAR